MKVSELLNFSLLPIEFIIYSKMLRFNADAIPV